MPFPTPGRDDLVVLVQAGPLTQSIDDAGNATGLEHDLVKLLAEDLGVEARYIVAKPREIAERLDRGEAHLAISWYTPQAGEPGAAPPFIKTRDVLVQHEASLPIDTVGELAGHRVHVAAASRQAATLRAIAATTPGLEIVEEPSDDPMALVESVGDMRMETALVDSAMLDVAMQFVPSIQSTLEIGDEQPVTFRFGKKANPELVSRASALIARALKDGTIARIKDRYLGHVERLGDGDIRTYLEKIETVLPKLRKLFFNAQIISGIDWRLIAAVAYHESQWNPEATSPTGVRGIMMLTEETADRLGVTNRLDAKESILAGGRYLDYLKSTLPASAQEPDRTWLALAAYNLGPGHFNAARSIATQLKADPDSWYEMKRILPLLAQPKYYSRLKSGRARGGEAVILVENIRSYYDILCRRAPAYVQGVQTGGATTGATGLRASEPGLKPQKR